MKTYRNRIMGCGLCAAVLLAASLTGCSADNPALPGGDPSLDQELLDLTDKDVQVLDQDGSLVPAEIAQVAADGAALAFWPYTGTSLAEVPSDPINLVFKGQADPVQIRQALVSLDGDRTAFGLPDQAPFNLPWTDAVGGDVQTTYLQGGGWEGSVIQLTLGQYHDLRVHLRLFGTGRDDGQGGVWSLGGAHFEIMIPGTTEHAVLSWELAEQIVTLDLIRCGLLAAEPAPTGSINAAPDFRTIPSYVYNPLAEDGLGQLLLTMLGYPVAPATYAGSVVVDFGQAIPRPVCNDGPYDWLYVTGPVTFTTSVEVNGEGVYHYRSDYRGRLEAVPIDITTYQPIGDPFVADVAGEQNGKTGPHTRKVRSWDKRLAKQHGAPEMLTEILQVGSVGTQRYRAYERCFAGD